LRPDDNSLEVELAEIVNLNRVKKAKKRESEQRQAAENRVRFGRSKTEKENDRREAERRRLLLAGKELSPNSPKDDGENGDGDGDQK
jgi:hypothetical protein